VPVPGRRAQALRRCGHRSGAIQDHTGSALAQQRPVVGGNQAPQPDQNAENRERFPPTNSFVRSESRLCSNNLSKKYLPIAR
jgi:hypothetical protein